jgi:ABC transporter substrate binding protein
MSNEHVQAVIALVDRMFFQERKRIAQLAASARLPAVYGFREHVDAGGLISYGVNLADNFRRAATYVVKILKGAKPGDLAVEFPNKLELIINLKTSKALGGRPFADTARADRRGDRIEMPFAAAHESVVGTKLTSPWPQPMSDGEGEADIDPSMPEVCF